MRFVTECAENLKHLVMEVPALSEGKAMVVVTAEQLEGKISLIPKPAVGVMYEGARAITAGDSGGRQVGVSGEITFTLLLVSEVSVLSAALDTSVQVHEMLDSIREAIQGTRSPTGHLWRWVLEAPAKTKNNLTVWVQRWACPCQLPPRKNIG